MISENLDTMERIANDTDVKQTLTMMVCEFVIECDEYDKYEQDRNNTPAYIHAQVAFAKGQHLLKVLRKQVRTAYANEVSRIKQEQAVPSPVQLEAPQHKRRGRPPKFSYGRN